MGLQTPVLFIVFNRPDTTRRVFEAIRNAKPKELFVAADGPRADRAGEKELCEATRKIATAVDWDCKVVTLFRDENVGGCKGPAEAISWFFSQVEKGIILEDDCLPAPSFFKFCEELLEKYKSDERIDAISGTNLLKHWSRNNTSYFFSVNASIWGWATWARAWKQYSYYPHQWEHQDVRELFSNHFKNAVEREVYTTAINNTFNGQATTWDYQWIFSRIVNGRFGIIPKVNLISNIGFGPGATRTTDESSEISNMAVDNVEFPLIAPRITMIDHEYDVLLSSRFYPVPKKITLTRRIKQRARNLGSRILKKNK